MNERRTAVAVGGLYILGTVSGVASVILAGFGFGAPDPFTGIAALGPRMQAGAQAILTMGLALAFVPILMYPILKRESEVSAVGYVVFRGALETVTYILITACWIVLAGLAPQIVRAGEADGAGLRAAGEAVLRISEAVRMMTVFTFSLGALILYGSFYRSRLVPRWISVWGLAAILVDLGAGFFDLFRGNGRATAVPAWIHFPIFLQEMVMAVWMIVKGFRASAGIPGVVPGKGGAA
ncbi:MAG TPA: DUF4386 domain-containing protein [Spirochaetia bacterium]|nr:DUF4386 domain-containing protein [Spirochaetales bacterium]HRY79249.1 DUF4386 domain-containing protein [Spirochaetia bacterium]HRZ89788.1 DUF4386 domain-containing protein [Spirochaetia bacterium]